MDKPEPSCLYCKHCFITSEGYGSPKCSKFQGSSNFGIYYCSTAREIEHLCGRAGKHYEQREGIDWWYAVACAIAIGFFLLVALSFIPRA